MRTALLAVVLSAVVVAQEPLRFEAASIKPADARASLPRGPGLFSVPFATAQQLIGIAYGLPEYRVVGAPDWARNDRFQVLAKAGAPASGDEMRTMERALLAERFGLRAHTETRELPTYALVFARADHRPGPGLTPAPVDCEPFRTGKRPLSESPLMTIANGRSIPRCGTSMTFSTSTGVISPNFNGTTMESFVDFLSRQLGRSVADRTGLEGSVDVQLSFVDENLAALPGPRRTGEGPSLMTALQEQLGLKLEPSRGPVDVLVVDAVERPSAD